MTTSARKYQDDLGNTIILGRELARGGEGIVCLVEGRPDIVAKLYLDKALKKHDKANKIIAMCKLFDKNIAKFSALPQRVLYDNRGRVAGFLMEKINGFEEIHKLYNISNKRKYFSFADWGFMVHAAKNLACAIETLHSKDIVIGDLNQGNILVDNQAMIKLIDCDSYQVEYNGKCYLCEVGVPEYTSPELQGQSFAGIHRTKNHDAFGLAVMIFKIIMFGKHPYSGVGAPSEIENAIQQGYYSFASGTLQPPPGSAQSYYFQIFSTLNNDIKDMFERAFSSQSNIQRPTAQEWITALDKLEKELITCPKKHKYIGNSKNCIWCMLEKQRFAPFENKSPKPSFNPIPTPVQTPYRQQQYNTSNNFSSTDIIMFLKQHIQAVVGVIFVVLIVVVLSNLEEPSSTTYTPNVTTEQEQQTYTHQDKAYTTTSQNHPSATKPKEVSEISNTVKSKNIDEFKSIFLKTVQNNWKQDPNKGKIAVEVTLNKNGSIASIKSLDEISTNPEHPDYNFIRAKNAIKKNVSWGSLPSNYSSNTLTLQLQFSMSKVEFINNSRRTNYSTPKGMVKQENTPNVQNNTSSKVQTTKQEVPRSTKTDLQKSQDWFFE